MTRRQIGARHTIMHLRLEAGEIEISVYEFLFQSWIHIIVTKGRIITVRTRHKKHKKRHNAWTIIINKRRVHALGTCNNLEV